MIFKEEKIHTLYIKTVGGRNQEFDLRNYVFKNFWFLLHYFFNEDKIVKVGIDHAICEEIAATDSYYPSKLK